MKQKLASFFYQKFEIKQVHIAFLTSEYPHSKISHSAGIGTSIKNLADELVKLKHTITIFVYAQSKNEIFIENGINIHKIAYKKYTAFGWYLYRKKIQNYINKIILNDGINLVEAPDWTGITAFMKLQCPLVIRLHGTDTYFCYLEHRKQKLKNYFFENKALKSADIIVSVSKFTADLTKKLFNLSTEIPVIHNGVYTSSLKDIAGNILINKNEILYFGSIISKKGVLKLATIFNKVIEIIPEATLTLLGKDVIDAKTGISTLALVRDKLSEQAKKQINYIAEVRYEQVANYIKKASVIVLPSLAEAFPMTWLESMTLGKPLVTSDFGWAHEIMIDGITGFMVNPSNEKEYANKICTLLNDKALGIELGRNAQNHIKKYFSQKEIAIQNSLFYQKIIDGTF